MFFLLKNETWVANQGSKMMDFSCCPTASPHQKREHARDAQQIDRVLLISAYRLIDDTVTSFTQLGHMTRRAHIQAGCLVIVTQTGGFNSFSLSWLSTYVRGGTGMHAVTTQPHSARSCDRRLPFLKHPCMMPTSFYPQTGRTMSSEPKGIFYNSNLLYMLSCMHFVFQPRKLVQFNMETSQCKRKEEFTVQCLHFYFTDT
jgi:hypothetical protein